MRGEPTRSPEQVFFEIKRDKHDAPFRLDLRRAELSSDFKQHRNPRSIVIGSRKDLAVVDPEMIVVSTHDQKFIGQLRVAAR